MTEDWRRYWCKALAAQRGDAARALAEGREELTLEQQWARALEGHDGVDGQRLLAELDRLDLVNTTTTRVSTKVGLNAPFTEVVVYDGLTMTGARIALDL